MSRQSVAKAHQKIQELAWEPMYHSPVSQYGTDYTFRKAAKKDQKAKKKASKNCSPSKRAMKPPTTPSANPSPTS